jgi:hypothetical protein
MSGARKCEELDEAVYTEPNKTRRVRNTNSRDWCCLAVPVAGPVKTVIWYSKDGELHIMAGQLRSDSWQENRFCHLTTMSWKIPGHMILFSGARGSLPRVIAARAKCSSHTPM